MNRDRSNLETLLRHLPLSEAARAMILPLIAREDRAERIAQMAQLFQQRGQWSQARILAHLARHLAPGDANIEWITDWQHRSEIAPWHFAIVRDELRNGVYARALERWVEPGMTVFEIGTGTGLMAMLAVRAGARHVYTCEVIPEIAAMAREIVARNRMADRITVIEKHASDLELGIDLPHRADLFVAEILDSNVVGEDVLPMTRLARERFLTPEAPLLPEVVSARGALASVPMQRRRFQIDPVLGFDLSPLHDLAPGKVMLPPQAWPDIAFLSPPEDLLTLDLRTDPPEHGGNKIRLTPDRAGMADGVVSWLRLDFGDGIAYEAPPPHPTCWHPLLHMTRQPFSVVPDHPVDGDLMYMGRRMQIDLAV